MTRALAFIFILSTIGSCMTYSQDTIRTFKKYVVVQQNGERIEGENGTLTPGQFSGLSPNGTPFSISKKDIKTLFVQTGSNAGTYALYGGLIGLGTGLLAYISWSADPMRNNSGPSPLVLTLAATACGAIIGGIIGSSFSDWRIEPIVASVQMRPNDIKNGVYAVRLSVRL